MRGLSPRLSRALIRAALEICSRIYRTLKDRCNLAGLSHRVAATAGRRWGCRCRSSDVSWYTISICEWRVALLSNILWWSPRYCTNEQWRYLCNCKFARPARICSTSHRGRAVPIPQRRLTGKRRRISFLLELAPIRKCPSTMNKSTVIVCQASANQLLIIPASRFLHTSTCSSSSSSSLSLGTQQICRPKCKFSFV